MTISCSVVVAIVLRASAYAQTPIGTAFTYQGRLDQAGVPVNGNADFRVTPFDAAVGGNQVGPTRIRTGVGVVNGLFAITLDFGDGPLLGNASWLNIEVRSPSGVGDFTAMSPRQELTVAPNAVFALNAGKLDGLHSTAFLQSIPLPLTLSGTSATHIVLGENASTANNARGVHGQSTAFTGTTTGVWGQSDSASGRGVYGFASAAAGAAYGGRFESNSTSGRGVYATADAATGTTYGGRFESGSTSGRGVYGLAYADTGATYGGSFLSSSTSGTGVLGHANADSGLTYGVRGENSSGSGRGVQGVATAAYGNSYGGLFESASTSGRGVFGTATADSGTTYGGLFHSGSTSGFGIYGWTTATTGSNYGGWFQNASNGGRGVVGWATADTGATYGVYGQSDSLNGRGVAGNATYSGAGFGYGIYGMADLTGFNFAVFASGDLGASGTKSFRIDHPDDPTNKYLFHYAAESPEIINFYRGTVTLDSAGQAVVALPQYFAKINRTPSYQLTAVGAPMPNLHVAEEIDEAALTAGATCEPGQVALKCSFRIAGGVPGGKVSWRVEAVRNDRGVQRRGAPVEVEKQGLERGTYQHPELYGRPPETGMNYDAERERPRPVSREEHN